MVQRIFDLLSEKSRVLDLYRLLTAYHKKATNSTGDTGENSRFFRRMVKFCNTSFNLTNALTMQNVKRYTWNLCSFWMFRNSYLLNVWFRWEHFENVFSLLQHKCSQWIAWIMSLIALVLFIANTRHSLQYSFKVENFLQDSCKDLARDAYTCKILQDPCKKCIYLQLGFGCQNFSLQNIFAYWTPGQMLLIDDFFPYSQWVSKQGTRYTSPFFRSLRLWSIYPVCSISRQNFELTHQTQKFKLLSFVHS